MSKLKTMVNLFKNNPKKVISAMGRNNMLNWIPDKLYLKIVYYCETGKKLDLKTPTTFNEKLQWLKLYDRKEDYVTYVDKLAVREHVKQTIGKEYLIPLIGVYNTVDEIPWDDFPNQFVLKCTHGSGCNIICTDKKVLDIKKTKRKLQKWMRKNYYWSSREWPYKNVIPRIICEEFMIDQNSEELKDYKIYCFQGEPKIIHVDIEKSNNHRRNIYDLDWNLLYATIQYPNDTTIVIPRPINFELLLKLSRDITSSNHPHVRTDFYIIGEQIYFGEMTFYNGAGFEKFSPSSLEIIMGEWIRLPSC